MSPSTDRSRDDRPTIAEVAALTRRLRELSAQGRDADPAERAAFLAEKDALIARITAEHDAGPAPADARAGVPDRELHRHHAQLNRQANPTADAGDGPDVVFDPEDSQWWHPGGSARLDLPHPDALPPWEQPAQAVDPDELAARAAALHGHIVARNADPATVWECERPVSWGAVVDGSELEARREQLARWHHDDSPAVEQHTEMSGFIDPPYDDASDSGWSR